MRPRLSKKQLTSSPVTPRTYTPSPGPKPPTQSTRARVPPLVFLPHRKTLVQNHYLPRLSGQVGFAGDRLQDGRSRPIPEPNTTELHDDMGFNDGPFVVDHQDIVDSDYPPISRHRRKKAKQWERWQNEVIPRLIAPYMVLLYDTESLRRPLGLVQTNLCTCGEPGRLLNVIIVHFASEYLLQLHVW